MKNDQRNTTTSISKLNAKSKIENEIKDQSLCSSRLTPSDKINGSLSASARNSIVDLYLGKYFEPSSLNTTEKHQHHNQSANKLYEMELPYEQTSQSRLKCVSNKATPRISLSKVGLSVYNPNSVCNTERASKKLANSRLDDKYIKNLREKRSISPIGQLGSIFCFETFASSQNQSLLHSKDIDKSRNYVPCYQGEKPLAYNKCTPTFKDQLKAKSVDSKCKNQNQPDVFKRLYKQESMKILFRNLNDLEKKPPQNDSNVKTSGAFPEYFLTHQDSALNPEANPLKMTKSSSNEKAAYMSINNLFQASHKGKAKTKEEEVGYNSNKVLKQKIINRNIAKENKNDQREDITTTRRESSTEKPKFCLPNFLYFKNHKNDSIKLENKEISPILSNHNTPGKENDQKSFVASSTTHLQNLLVDYNDKEGWNKYIKERQNKVKNISSDTPIKSFLMEKGAMKMAQINKDKRIRSKKK